jgi:hypothetical protein
MNVRYFNLLNMSAVLCVILAITVHYVLHVIFKDGSCGIVCLLVRFRYVGKRCLWSYQLPPLSFALSIRPSSFAVSLSSVPLFLYRIIHKSSGTSELGCATTKTDTAERSYRAPVR